MNLIDEYFGGKIIRPSMPNSSYVIDNKQLLKEYEKRSSGRIREKESNGNEQVSCIDFTPIADYLISILNVHYDNDPVFRKYRDELDDYIWKRTKKTLIQEYKRRNDIYRLGLSADIIESLVEYIEVNDNLEKCKLINEDTLLDYTNVLNTIRDVYSIMSLGYSGFSWQTFNCDIHRKKKEFADNYFDLEQSDKMWDYNECVWIDRPKEIIDTFPVHISFGCSCHIAPPYDVVDFSSKKPNRIVNEEPKIGSVKYFLEFCKRHKIYESDKYNLEDMKQLLNEYNDKIIPANCYYSSVPILLYVIALCEYSLGDVAGAYKHINEAINNPNISKEVKKKCSVLLAKIQNIA